MYYIGVDLGGTNIVVGIVNQKGEVIRKKSTPTLRERSHEEILKDIAVLCKEVMKEEKITKEQVTSIGVGSPGTADPEQGMILYANNIRFKDVHVRDEIQKYIDLPVHVENDANCAALGEVVAGAAKEFKDAVIITLGTGVGGGIVIDGKIFGGSFFGGAELGHHVIEMDGRQCTCGRKGCLEAYASATALINDAKAAAKAHPESMLNKMVDGNLSNMNAKVVFDAKDSGDTVAIELVQNYYKYLSVGIVNVVNIFQPEVVLIGGGICAQKEKLLQPLQALVENELYGGEMKTLLRIAELGNDAGLIGAAMLGACK